MLNIFIVFVYVDWWWYW